MFFVVSTELSTTCINCTALNGNKLILNTANGTIEGVLNENTITLTSGTSFDGHELNKTLNLSK